MRTDSSNPATNHPGEHGLGIVVVGEGSGWRESAGEVLWRGKQAKASAAREGSIPARWCLPGLEAVVGVEYGSGRGGAVLSGAREASYTRPEGWPPLMVRRGVAHAVVVVLDGVSRNRWHRKRTRHRRWSVE